VSPISANRLRCGTISFRSSIRLVVISKPNYATPVTLPSGRASPQRFDMQKAVPRRPTFVPLPNIGEVNIAEADTLDVLLLEALERGLKCCLEVARMGGLRDQLQSEGLGLRFQKFLAHAVEANATGIAFVNVHEVCDLKALLLSSIERQKRVLASAPEQGIAHAAAARSKRTLAQLPGRGGAAKISGWMRCTMISRLSTMRGPDRLK